MIRQPRPLALVVLALAIGCTRSTPEREAPPRIDAPVLPISTPRIVAENPREEALHFEPNRGQSDAGVLFLAHEPGYSMFLGAREASLVLLAPETAPPTPGALLRMTLVGAAETPVASGVDELRSHTNYDRGNDPQQWLEGVPHYAAVLFREVYPGIDVRWHGSSEHELEYDFTLAPGADPSRIALEITGATHFGIDLQGNLRLTTSAGSVSQKKPVAWQEIGGVRHPVAVAFRRHGSRIGFDVGAHDASLSLVIDPSFHFRTNLQVADSDAAAHVVVDAAGNSYVAGVARRVTGPSDLIGNNDAFVTKLDAGGAPLSTTILGGLGSGDGDDRANGIALDAGGNVYLTGSTTSTNFPTVSGLQGMRGGGADAFITELNASGSIVFSDYLGGSGNDHGAAVAIGPGGDFYVTGDTDSANFPVVAGSFQTSPGGTNSDGSVDDAFVTRFRRNVGLNTIFYSRVYSSFLGGDGHDVGTGIAVDSVGNAYVTGETNVSGLITISCTGRANVADAFVVEVNAAGTSKTFSTCFGGNNTDHASGIALDPTGNLWITGRTDSTDLPTTANAVQGTSTGGQRAFVAELSSAGAKLYATYWGGVGTDSGNAIAANALGVYVTGATDSTNFRTDNAPPENAGPITASTAFLSHLAPGAVMYSMFVAGRYSAGTGVAVDAAGNAWVCGSEGLRPFSHSFVEKISPIAGTPDSLTLAEDSPPVSVTLTATDTDGQTLTLSLSAAPAHGTVSAVSATTCQFYNYRSTCTASVSYSPAPDYFGADSFSFTAGDGTLVSPPAAVSINVTPINDAPVAAAQFVAVAEDSSVTITVTANDIDNISLSLALVPGSGPFHGALSTTTLSPVCVPPLPHGGPAGSCSATLTYTPDPNFNGADRFAFRASDGVLDSLPAVVTLTVTPVPDPPVAVGDSFSTSQGTLLAVDSPGVLANDIDLDGKPLTPVLGAAPAHGALVLRANGGFSWTPSPTFSGADSFTYRASDGVLLSNEVTVQFTVTPLAQPDSTATLEGVPVTTNVVANDPGVNLAPAPSEEVHYCYDGFDADCGGSDADNARKSRGRLSRVADKPGAVELGYDAAGRAVSETRAFAQGAAATFATTTAFDDNGNAASVTYPSGLRIDRLFDETNRETTLFESAGGSTIPIVTIDAWYPFGGLRAWESAGNTVSIALDEDAGGWITRVASTAPVPEEITYAYANDGNVTSIDGSPGVFNVSHDSLSRLTNDRGRVFSYDDAGNRVSGPGGAIVYTNPPNAASDLWSSADGGAIPYSFDAAGNVTRRGAVGLLTADDGSVIAFDHATAGRTRELRDYRNLRVARSGAAGEETYFYSPGGELVEKRGAVFQASCSGTATRFVTPVENYVYAGGRRLALVRSTLQGSCGAASGGPTTLVVEGEYLYFADKMDLARALYRAADGKQVWFGEFDAFGTPLFIDEDPDRNGVAFTNDFRLPGQVALSAVEGGPTATVGGLVENWNRVYDEEVGRYLEPDPLGQGADPAAYRYVADRPFSAIDPAGLDVTTSNWRRGGTGRSQYPHMGISVDVRDDCCKVTGHEYWDLTPGVSTLPKNMFPNPGIIGNAYPGGRPLEKTYCTSCEQDRKARAFAQAAAVQGMTYSWCGLGGENCYGFVDQILSAGGITDSQLCGGTGYQPGGAVPPAAPTPTSSGP